MMKDKYANYVVQKAVEVTKPPLRDVLIRKIMAIPDPNNYCKRTRINLVAQHVFHAVSKVVPIAYPGQQYPYMK